MVARLGGQLGAAGLAPGDRVAIVLPNGPAMALSFLAAATSATAAPLNPRYRDEELARSYQDLGVRAVVAAPETAPAAHAAAPAHALRLTIEGAGFDVSLYRDDEPLPEGAAPSAEPGDVAVVLQTSGTTSRPKTVPLTHRKPPRSPPPTSSTRSPSAPPIAASR